MRWQITIETSRRHRPKNRQKVRVQNTNAKSRAQSSRADFTSAKTRNSIFWKFLGNHMMEISWNYMLGNFWKLYAGNLLMETMCWEIWVWKRIFDLQTKY